MASQYIDLPQTSGGGSGITQLTGDVTAGPGSGSQVATLGITTTKGDLIVNNGSANVRLAVGADGTVLSADSSQATGLKYIAASGSGTVTSVALTVPSILSVAGSPITTAGTLAVTLATQAANIVFAGPTSGGAATPAFRALVTADMPAGTGTVTSVAASVPAFLSVAGSPITASGTLAITLSGTALPIANGGTAGTTANGAFNNLSPLTTKGDLIGFSTVNARLAVGSDGQVLTADAASTLGVKWAAAAGTGTVTSVAMTVPAFLSVAGSPVTTAGTLAVTLSGTALPIANGGTAGTSATTGFNNLSPMTTAGDIIIGGVSGAGTRLGIGSATQVLTVVAGAPAWAAAGGGSSAFTILSKNANYTVTTTDFSNVTLFLLDTTGGAFNLTLPDPTTLSGQRIMLKDSTFNFSVANLTVVRFGSEKIENIAASKVFATTGGSWTITTNGTDWFLL